MAHKKQRANCDPLEKKRRKRGEGKDIISRHRKRGTHNKNTPPGVLATSKRWFTTQLEKNTIKRRGFHGASSEVLCAVLMPFGEGMHSSMQLEVERHTWVSGVVGSTRTGGGTQAAGAVLAPAAGTLKDPQKTAGPEGKR